MLLRRLAAPLLLAAILAGCAATPATRLPTQAAPERYAFEGRFALRQGQQHHAGRISWSHAADADRILLADPFGSGIAELDRQPGRTRLTLADGRSEEDGDAATLIRRLTGVPLPIGAIGTWLTGRIAAGDPPDAVETDALGRTASLRRDGWRVRFDYADDAADALPARIFAEGADDLELRLSIERWEDLP